MTVRRTSPKSAIVPEKWYKETRVPFQSTAEWIEAFSLEDYDLIFVQDNSINQHAVAFTGVMNTHWHPTFTLVRRVASSSSLPLLAPGYSTQWGNATYKTKAVGLRFS